VSTYVASQLKDDQYVQQKPARNSACSESGIKYSHWPVFHLQYRSLWTLSTFCQHNESEDFGGESGKPSLLFRRMKKQFNAGNETTRLVKSAEFLEQARDNYVLVTNSV